MLVLLLAAAGFACSVPSEYSNTPFPQKPQTDTLANSKPIPLPEPDSVGDVEQTFLDAGLVDVQTLNPEIQVALQYSTVKNFSRADLYGPLKKCYLQKAAAEKLAKAQEILGTQNPGWHLLCLDCARPRSVQQRMWDSLQIPNKVTYLTPPTKGSMHNYGVAIDLTISDEKGKKVDMGTEFDFFGPEAQPRYEAQMLKEGKITQTHIDNRKILKQVMREARYSNIITEWWHYIAFSDSVVFSRYRIIE